MKSIRQFVFSHIITLLERIMASIADLETKITALTAAVAAEEAKVQAALTAANAALAAAQAAANGDVVPQADLDAIQAAIDSLNAQ